MKVTRLRRGFRINLSDAEMEALRHLVTLGGEDVSGDPDGATSVLSPAAKAVIRRGRIGNIAALDTDDDRR
jgi:hypothetical protein